MLTSEEMRRSLRAFAKAVPIRKELLTPVLSAIEVLRESDVQALLWRLGRPATRWRLLHLMAPTIGADRAFVALAQLPVVEAPTAFAWRRRANGRNIASQHSEGAKETMKRSL